MHRRKLTSRFSGFVPNVAVSAVLIALFGEISCKKTEPVAGPSPTPEVWGAPSTSPVVAPSITNDVATQLDMLAAKWAQQNAVDAKVTIELNEAAGYLGETKGDGTYVYRFHEGKPYIRFWFKNVVGFKQEDEKVIFTGEVVRHWVKDGLHHVYLQQPKVKKVTRKKYDPANVLQLGGPTLMDEIKQAESVSLLPSEQVDGIDTIAFETKNGDMKARHYFDPATGIRVRYDEFDPDGSLHIRIALSEIQLGGEFSEDPFEAEVPPGFELVDETKPAP